MIDHMDLSENKVSADIQEIQLVMMQIYKG